MFLWERIRKKSIHVVSSLKTKAIASCIEGKIRFWIFRFFRRDESAINPFSDFLFLSQKRIPVISRNNPILDFAKEMHP